MFDAAVAAADPLSVVPRYLGDRPRGRVVVVGAGKASARMARAVERSWPGPLSGMVVTRYGHAVPCELIEVVEAAHPVPDQASERAARRALELVTGLGNDDLLIALISGGGSSLLAAPAPGIGLGEKQRITRELLRSGAPIDQVNTVRRHLSAVKGGRLGAAAYPARTLGLLVSDVPGDDPAAIASGPTVAVHSQPVEAARVLERFRIDVPDSVMRCLAASNGAPLPSDTRVSRVCNHVVAAPQQSLEAAAEVARSHGITPVLLGDAIEGEAREVGVVLAGIAQSVRRHGQPARPPCVLLSGGETTVTVRGDGSGGRNVEFALSLALALRGAEGIYAIACDTDGVDGAEEVAGAHVAPETLDRAQARGLSPREALETNDAHRFFAALGDQVITGPTMTNVNDFRAILIV